MGWLKTLSARDVILPERTLSLKASARDTDPGVKELMQPGKFVPKI